jgi:hypothetical protein
MRSVSGVLRSDALQRARAEGHKNLMADQPILKLLQNSEQLPEEELKTICLGITGRVALTSPLLGDAAHAPEPQLK